MWTADGHGAVRVRMGTTGIAAAQPRTVMEVVEETCKAVPDHNALAVETQPGTWTFTTYKVDGKIYLALKRSRNIWRAFIQRQEPSFILA